MTVPTEYLDWWRRGEEHLGTAVGRLTDEDFAGPSRLPGWTRAHLVAHLTGNAGALVNLLTWARTGVETPTYPSRAQRDAEIAERATLPPQQLRADLLAAVQRLVAAMREVPDEAWTTTVRDGLGHEVPAAQIPWMRTRETWVHAVDLDAGVGFDEIPEEVLTGLIDDVFRAWTGQDTVPDVVVFAGDREWGTGALAVAGSLPEVAAWLLGRSDGAALQADGPLPELSRWR